ncbi:fimbria/pilus outer membrane usher protein, partial [Buttiauxella ferragutiae]|uniref:fimbria/pilus outer membrane usher protein n=1 Tax=Buttiauxella ferragutiae TaxID=82989 RepID=UPI0035259543
MRRVFIRSFVYFFIPTLLSLSVGYALAVDFNTDVLDTEDRGNINLDRFSQAGYIMPGQYQLQITVNGNALSPSASLVTFAEPVHQEKPKNQEKSIPQACLSREIVSLIGLTDASLEKVLWPSRGETECADFSQLPGVEIRPDLSASTLNINIPQAWLEYTDATWLPPSRWDDGIPGVLFDYNANALVTQPQERDQTRNLSVNGTTGANMGPWRLRANYQGQFNDTESGDTSNQFEWNRIYLYRSLTGLKARLTLGENYTTSDIFSSWNYIGASLVSDERMLPPKLRGYAPQVSGIAETNARVVISQQGRILYDTTVPAGAFTIQDLDSSVRGRLDVEVTEQNGQKKKFQVDTAYVPYLTRPGQVRYKVSGGKPQTYDHNTEGPAFVSGEASWGINNQWSLYGGSIVSGHEYNALAMGVGRDLNEFGTLSTDLTQAMASFDDEHRSLNGKSLRISYSKRFDDANADITFAGYRFSENDYMTMQQYLDARYRNNFSSREKELYTTTINKSFGEEGRTSVGLQLSHQTYWDNVGGSDYYNLSLNRYMDIADFRGISLNLSASRSRYYNKDNDAFFFRVSVPTGRGATTSYSASSNNKRLSQMAG